MPRKSKKKHEVSLEEKLDLTKDFSPPDYNEWKEAAIKDLKGKNFEKELFTQTYEEIILKPIYTREDLTGSELISSFPGFRNYMRGTRADGYIEKSWDICQEIPDSSAEEFNTNLKHDLQKGQTAVSLKPDLAFQMGKDADNVAPDGRELSGISISYLDDLLTALSGIDVQKTPIHIWAGYSPLIMIMMLTAFAGKEKIDTRKIHGSIDGDPLGFLIREGMIPIPIELAFDQIEWSIRWAKIHFPGLRIIGVDTVPYHNSGASAVQELAFAMASGVEYINQLKNRKLSVDDITQNIRFTFAAGPLFFMEVAKFRAVKILWSRIISEYGGGVESQKIRIHARTSNFNQCFYDPYVNMLRATTESLSAIIGGIDSLHVSAFNESFTQPDEFSRRIARNTQIILEKETHLRNPIDPAGGSYYVETLTSELAQRAWGLFQEIEKEGGMQKAVQKEFLQKKIAEVADKKNKDIASRKMILVGTNLYANVRENISGHPEISNVELRKNYSKRLKRFRLSRDKRSYVQGLEELSLSLEAGGEKTVQAGSEAFLKGATVGEVAEFLNGKETTPVRVNKLKMYRPSAVFENLRLKVDRHCKTTGLKPRIFLVLWGKLPQFQTRADFSRGFFEVAGCEVIDSSGSEEIPEIIQAAVDSQARIIVLCSSDDQYRVFVPEFVRKIKKKSPEIICVLAGNPKTINLISDEAEIDEFIYHGVDAPKILTALLTKIGVALI